MKINTTTAPLGNLAASQSRENTKTTPAAARPAAGQASEVALSSLSTRLQEIGAASSTEAVVDLDRVNAIREAIAAGSFKIDTSRIADGLIDSVRQMLSTQK